MNAKMVLLPVADARPWQEAREWFADGLRLLRMRLAQWTTYAVLTIFVLILASFAGDMLVVMVAALGAWAGNMAMFAKMVLVNLAVIATHGGMFRSMTRVANEGGAVKIADMQWLFAASQRSQLVALAVFLALCSLGYALVEERLLAGQELFVPDANGLIVVDGKAFNLNQDLLMKMGMLFSAYTLLLSLFTWAVLPLMAHFAQVPFAQALRYNWDGLRKNVVALGYFGLLILLVYFAIGLVVALLANLVPLLLLPFAAVISVWALVLNNAWMYAAFRHIYTDW
ncbi:MAG: hypothetical protein Q4D61_07210 [Cardiobacteriaceae bacterium]|nr:hypothetical protein [Cardiobacteriaceae bacterium]